MPPTKRAQIRTSIEIVFDDDAPGWLSHLQLTRDGNQIKISVVKDNGYTYNVDPLCLADFNKLIDTLLDP
jgi:hypothetical protein